jgi:hypothetical protein
MQLLVLPDFFARTPVATGGYEPLLEYHLWA